MKTKRMWIAVLSAALLVSNVNAALIGDWSMNEGTGQWAYNAVEGQADLRLGTSAGTWQDPEWTTAGYSGGALHFYSAVDRPDGILDILRPTTAFDLSAFNTTSFTLEAWIKLDAIPESTFDAYNPYTILSFGGKDSTNANKDAYFLRITRRAADGTGILNGYFFNSAGTGVSTIHSTRLEVGQWYHVGYSYDNSATANNISIWVDGVEEKASSSLLPRTDLTITGDSLVIGGMWTRTRGFNGTIDEVKIYNSAVPVPEPASLILLAAGIGAWVGGRRK